MKAHKKWMVLLAEAIKHKAKSEWLLDIAAQELMRTKGFTEEQVSLFGACFAGGHETIVHFNSDGEDNDLGVENYATMSKEEIIGYLKRFLTKGNRELLTK